MENEVLTVVQSASVMTHPFREYDHFKITVRDEINSASESFVKIGYLLKVARDTDILINSGYSNYLEFAREEFSLDAGTVSRFIKINDKYSVGHNTPELLPEFKGYGRAKLQEMITLPDYITETFTPELTKSEIQTIKAEYEEEQAVTDLEVMMEDNKREFETNIRRFIFKLFKGTPALFKRVYEAVRKNRDNGARNDRDVIIDELLPGEIQLYIARPEGMGKMQLKLTEDMEGAELLSLRTGEKETVSQDDLIGAVLIQINGGLMNHEGFESGYMRRFKERFPDEERGEVAPVQPKPAKSRVTVANKPKKPESVQKEPENVENPLKKPTNEQKTSESEVLTSAPVAEDHQPDLIPEEKTEEKADTESEKIAEENTVSPAAEDHEKLSRRLNIWNTDISGFLKDIRNHDMHSLFTELTLNSQELDKNVRNMSREGKSISFTAAVNEARRIVCLLDEVQWRWNEKAELQKEINR